MLKHALLVALTLVTSTAMAADKVTEHTTKGGEKITVTSDKHDYGSRKEGSTYGNHGVSSNQTHAEANKEVKDAHPGSTSKGGSVSK